jgi:hypothetical protein
MSTTERELMTNLATWLRQRLPRTWSIEADEWEAAYPSLQMRWLRPDYRLTISTARGRPIRLAVEVKASVSPKQAFEVASSLNSLFRTPEADGVLLLTSFLSPRARELLAETSVSYADDTGNVRIAVDDPPLFIETSGLDRLPVQTGVYASSPIRGAYEGPYRSDRRLLQSFKGPGAALGVRALVDFRPPYRLRELAERAGVSLGTLSRVLEFAEGEVLIEREPRGPIVGVDWEQFLRRWAKDYSLLGSNRTRIFLEPRGIDALLPRLRTYAGQYALSGSLAAHTVAPEAPAALAVVYVSSLEAAPDLGLRETESGGNVLLVQPFPSAQGTQSLSPFLRTRSIDGLEYVALAQAVVDLLTSPGRGPAEAEALLKWMEANEDAWRIA